MRTRKRKSVKRLQFLIKVILYVSFLIFGLLFLTFLINSMFLINFQVKNDDIVDKEFNGAEYVYCEVDNQWFKLSKKTCLQIQNQYMNQQKSETNEEDYDEYEANPEMKNVNDDQEWGTTIKLDEHISVSKFGADSQMATVEELNIAMNEYRRVRNLSNLNIDGTLCEIAQRRADDQLENGELDNHAGFDSEFQNQNKFYSMGEVLFGGNQPVLAPHIVEWGWDQSLTGHKEAISDPSWTDGCGGIAGFYAVFIFGRK